MTKKFDLLAIRPKTKKKIKLEAAKKDKSIVEFMDDLFKDEEEIKKVRRDNDFFNL